MSVEQIYLYAETGAALAVVASVIYLGIQIRQGTKSARAAAIATLLSQYDSPNALIACNTENARIFRLGLEGGEELDEDQKFQFQFMMVQYMTVYHTVFRFHRDGILGIEQWSVFRRDLVEFTDYPGIVAMMAYHKAYYSPDPEFSRELERIQADHVGDEETIFIRASDKKK